MKGICKAPKKQKVTNRRGLITMPKQVSF